MSKRKNEETLLDQEIWRTIRYLDPDMNPKTGDSVTFIILLVVVFAAPVVCILLRLRGL